MKQKYKIVVAKAQPYIFAGLVEIGANIAVGYSGFIIWRNWVDYMGIEV
jgi:hypothetical protein